MDVLWIMIVCATVAANLAIKQDCNFGSGCRFPCQCAEGVPCHPTTGCDGNCSPGWSNPGCLSRANIARDKAATQSHLFYGKNDANKAVDGRREVTDVSACSRIRKTPDESSELWWSVQFDDIYRIEKVFLLVIGTYENGKEIGYYVTNETDAADFLSSYLCSTQTLYPDTNGVTVIQPPKGCVGRRLILYRRDTSPDAMLTLCEVVVEGHLVSDCERMCGTSYSDATSCDDEYGCIENCPEGKDPKTFCKEDCKNRRFGKNCKYTCGFCINGQICEKINGSCPNGCQNWYIPDRCKTYIGSSKLKNEDIFLTSTAYSISVRWNPVEYTSDVHQYYGYRIDYTPSGGEISSKHVHDNNTEIHTATTIENISPNTQYDVTVYPFRYQGDKLDAGTGSKTMTTKTLCTAPSQPTITNYTVNIPWNGSLELGVLHLESSWFSGCERFSRVRLTGPPEYQDIEEGTKMIPITLNAARTYDMVVTVVNNRGLTSTSDSYQLTIIDPSKPMPNHNGSSQTGLYAGMAVLLIIIVAGVVGIFIHIRRRQEQKAPSEGNCTYTLSDQSEPDVVPRATVHMTAPNVRAGKQKRPDRPPPDAKKSHAKKPPVHHPPDASADTESLDVMEGVEEDDEERIYENTQLIQKIIKLPDLAEYIQNMHEDDDEGFNTEYNALPKGHLAMSTAAQKKENIIKNRYKNIKAYDHSRVILVDNDGRDYINANYVMGYGNRQKKYIATQGPKQGTQADFWHMIWQENVMIIVMLTPVMENMKKQSEMYWPEKVGDDVTHGHVTITLRSQEVTAYYTHNVMILSRKKKSRTIHHFLFLAWPDKNRPEHIYSTMQLIWRVNHIGNNQSPIVVHCSAGIGRTGTYIALDYLLEQAEHEGLVDITSCVHLLRSKRTSLVQTLNQYIFLYDACQHYHLFGKTTVSMIDFRNEMTDINKMTSLTPAIHRQFQALDSIRFTHADLDGLSSENKVKNRDLNVIPGDQDRPYIMTVTDGGNSYINAIFIDTYERRDNALVTQVPLHDTVSDFWSLVIDQYCNVLLVLDSLDTNANKTVPVYWPPVGSRHTFGKVQVETKDQKTLCSNTILRNMTINKNNKAGRKPEPIVVVQYSGWPKQLEDWSKEKCSDVLLMVQHVYSIHQKHKENGKLLVQCLNGSDISGIFCVLRFALDHVTAYQEVDISMATQMAITKRPSFIQSEEDYLVLHKLVTQYVQGFDTYANFQ